MFINIKVCSSKPRSSKGKFISFDRAYYNIYFKVERLEDIATITLSDRVKRSMLSILGIKYESKKVEQQKIKLKEYREKL